MTEKIGLEAVMGMSDFQKGMSQYMAGIDKMNSQTGNFAGAATKHFQSFGKSVLGATAVMGGAMVAAAGAAGLAVGKFTVDGIKAAADLEAQLSGIAAVLGKTKDEVGPLNDLILKLGLDPNLKVTATEAADAIENLARNGLTMTEIIDGAAHSTVLLANATGADFGTAADIATDVMAQFGKEAGELGGVVDGIVATTNLSKMTIDDYRLALSQAGGVAASVGVSFEDFNTSIASTAPLFASGSDAGTSFKTFLTTLTPKSKEARKAMEALGLQFFDNNGAMKNGADIAEELNRVFLDEVTFTSQVNNATAEQVSQRKMLESTLKATKMELFKYQVGINGVAQSEEDKAVSIDRLNRKHDAAMATYEELASTLGTTVSVTRQLTEEEKIHYAQTIFGTDAMRTAFALAESGTVIYTDAALAAKELGVSQEEVNKVIEGGVTQFEALQLQMAQIDAQEQAATRMNNFKGKLEIVQGQIETLKITIGQQFLPLLTRIAEWAGEFVSKHSPAVIAAFASFAENLGALINYLSIVVTDGDLMNDWLTHMSPSLQAIVLGTIEWVSWINQTITAIQTFLEPIATAIASFVSWQDVMVTLGLAVASVVLPAIWGIIAALTPVILTVGAVLLAVAALRNAWVSDFMRIRTATTVAFGYITGALEPFTSSLSEHMSGALTEIKNWATGNETEFTHVKAIWDGAKTSGMTMFGDLKNYVTTNLPAWQGTLTEWGNAAGQWIVDAIPVVTQKLIEWWNALQAYVIENLPAWKAKLAEWGIIAWEWVVEAKNKVLEKLGEWWITISNYVAENLPAWKAKLLEWGAIAWDWIVEAAGVVREKLGEWWSNISSYVTEQLPTWKEKLIGWATAAWQWIVDAKDKISEKLGEWWEVIDGYISEKLPILNDKFVEWKDLIIAIGAVIAASLIPPLIAAAAAALPLLLAVTALTLASATIRKAWDEDWGGIQTKTKAVVDAIKPLIDSIKTGIDAFKKSMGEGKTATESLSDAVDAASKTEGIKNFKETLQEITDKITAIKKGIETFITNVKSWTDKITEFNDGFVQFKDILKAAAIVIELTLLPVIWSAVAAFGSLTLAALPWIALAAGLVLAIALLRTAWERDWLGIRTKTEAALKAIGDAMETVKTKWEAVKDTLFKWDAAIEQSQADFREKAGTTWTAIKETFTYDWKARGKEIIDGLRDGIELPEPLAKLVTAAKNMFGKITAAFDEIDWKKLGNAIIDGVTKGLEEKWDAIKAKIDELFAMLPQWAQDILGIASPSKVFMEIGENIVSGLLIGLSDIKDIKSVYNGLINSFKSFSKIANTEKYSGLIDNLDSTNQFLDAQLDLLDQLERTGIDPRSILGGVVLGIDADPDNLAASITGLLQSAQKQISEGLFRRQLGLIAKAVIKPLTDVLAAQSERLNSLVSSTIEEFGQLRIERLMKQISDLDAKIKIYTDSNNPLGENSRNHLAALIEQRAQLINQVSDVNHLESGLGIARNKENISLMEKQISILKQARELGVDVSASAFGKMNDDSTLTALTMTVANIQQVQAAQLRKQIAILKQGESPEAKRLSMLESQRTALDAQLALLKEMKALGISFTGSLATPEAQQQAALQISQFKLNQTLAELQKLQNETAGNNNLKMQEDRLSFLEEQSSALENQLSIMDDLKRLGLSMPDFFGPNATIEQIQSQMIRISEAKYQGFIREFAARRTKELAEIQIKPYTDWMKAQTEMLDREMGMAVSDLGKLQIDRLVAELKSLDKHIAAYTNNPYPIGDEGKRKLSELLSQRMSLINEIDRVSDIEDVFGIESNRNAIVLMNRQIALLTEAKSLGVHISQNAFGDMSNPDTLRALTAVLANIQYTQAWQLKKQLKLMSQPDPQTERLKTLEAQQTALDEQLTLLQKVKSLGMQLSGEYDFGLGMTQGDLRNLTIRVNQQQLQQTLNELSLLERLTPEMLNPTATGSVAQLYKAQVLDPMLKTLRETVMLESDRVALIEQYRQKALELARIESKQKQLDFLMMQIEMLNQLDEKFSRQVELQIIAGAQFGLNANLDELLAFAGRMTEALVNKVKNDLGISSPSKVFARIGQNIMSGFSRGINSMAAQPIQAFQQALRPLPYAMSGRALSMNMGGVTINNGMDEVMFEARVRQVVEGLI